MEEKFQMLQISFDGHVKVDTYDQSVVAYLVDELQAHHANDRISFEHTPNGLAVISARKKDNIKFSKPYIIHLLGSAGWEPFSVNEDSETYYFRKKTTI